ncbi:MAG: hypothetical protein H0U53_03910 [Actinobacteria bacterium]|nr:hypothetical protein [Actinomycetota bacterium]
MRSVGDPPDPKTLAGRACPYRHLDLLVRWDTSEFQDVRSGCSIKVAPVTEP